MTKRAAIILAGGIGKRFQSRSEIWQDKTLALLFDEPLLVHAAKSVREAVDEVVVCVNDETRKARYSQVLKDFGITDAKLIVDVKIDHMGGPLMAIFSGLKSVDADYCIILPGDMPLMQREVIEYMFAKAKDTRVVVPMWPNGRLETLIMALEKASALDISETLCLLGRPRSDDLIRGALNVTFISIIGELSSIDPELKSFVNINIPEDLSRLQPRRVEGPATRNLHFNRGTLPLNELRRLREVVTLCKEKKFSEATNILSSVGTKLEKEKSFFWAALSHENRGKSIISIAEEQNNPANAMTVFDEGIRAFLKASATYGLEAKMHQGCCSVFLAERAKSDMTWCQSRADELRTGKVLIQSGL